MDILVTGASGLLGSRLMEAFPDDWPVTGTYCCRPQAGMVECRLGNSHSVLRTVKGAGYDWVVHCAAIRSPDACEEDPRRAMEVNGNGTEWIARAAADAGTKLAYASTSYVFAGDAPPYKEDDATRPLNVYGHSKLNGERHALTVPGSLVVRMPALYSLDLDAPNSILRDLKQALDRGETVAADDRAARYYTLAEDVAAAFAFLMATGQRGVVHVSAQESSTKLEFLRAAAEAMGCDSALVAASSARPGPAPRPQDSHLDVTFYRSLGGPPLRGFRDALSSLRP